MLKMTKREIEKLNKQGWTDSEIAEKFQTGVRLVTYHRMNLKLPCRCTGEKLTEARQKAWNTRFGKGDSLVQEHLGNIAYDLYIETGIFGLYSKRQAQIVECLKTGPKTHREIANMLNMHLNKHGHNAGLWKRLKDLVDRKVISKISKSRYKLNNAVPSEIAK